VRRAAANAAASSAPNAAAAAASSSSPTAAATQELDALARQLLALHRAKVDASDPDDAPVTVAAAALEARARELGRAGAAAVRDRSFLHGEFRGHALTGRNVSATAAGPIPLGALAFNAYQPAGAMVRIVGGGDSPSRILRGGERFGVGGGGGEDEGGGGGGEAYVLSTAFDVVSLPAPASAAAASAFDAAAPAAAAGEGQAASAPPPPPPPQAAPPPRPLRGISHAVARGTWPPGEDAAGGGDPAPTAGGRMELQFCAMVLEPAPGTDLSDWLAAFGAPANPAMDAATGRLRVALPAKGPKGWLDHLMVTPEHTLIRGNFGSVSLLARCDGDAAAE